MNWDNRYATINFDKDIYVFKPTGTTTIEDTIEQLENIRECIKAVIESVEEIEGEEKISITTFMEAISETIKENLENAQGDPLEIEIDGVGYNLMTINLN